MLADIVFRVEMAAEMCSPTVLDEEEELLDLLESEDWSAMHWLYDDVPPGGATPLREEMSDEQAAMEEVATVAEALSVATPPRAATPGSSSHGSSASNSPGLPLVDLGPERALRIRRLSGKQPRPAAYVERDRKAKVRKLEDWQRSPDYKRFRRLGKHQRKAALNAWRARKCRAIKQLQAGEELVLSTGAALKLTDQAHPQVETNAHIMRWAEDLADAEATAKDVRGAAVEFLVQMQAAGCDERKRGECKIRTQSTLLTWNGDFGLAADPLPAAVDIDDLGAVEEYVRALDWVQSLWEHFSAVFTEWSRVHSFAQWAMSLEICTRSLQRERTLRVHFHGWFLQYVLPAIPLSVAQFTYLHSIPHVSSFISVNSRAQNAKWAGCFYVVCPKLGSLFSHSTKEMFVDYTVAPGWVTQMLSAKKISLDVAQDLFVSCVGYVEPNLKALEVIRQHRQRKLIDSERMAVEHEIRRGQRPFKVVPQVEQWKEQYNDLRDRYKFLVLDGPSRTGKSRFAGSLARDPARFLNIDCSSATEPDMRDFRRGQHDVVCWDEGSPEMVLRVKKLAQASVDEVRLGQSATNLVSYRIWFHRTMLVVCSNVWWVSLEQLRSADKEWLLANSVYVFVDSPLHE